MPAATPSASPGLQKTYGITFKSFKTLDADGPLTYQALTSGQIDVGEVFSTDAQVVANNLVVLNDDKHLQAADAITPVIANAKATSGVTDVVNKVSAALTTEHPAQPQQVGRRRPPGPAGRGRRVAEVESAWHQLLDRRLGRVDHHRRVRLLRVRPAGLPLRRRAQGRRGVDHGQGRTSAPARRWSRACSRVSSTC